MLSAKEMRIFTWLAERPREKKALRTKEKWAFCLGTWFFTLSLQKV
jgi:hypothetical protein